LLSNFAFGDHHCRAGLAEETIMTPRLIIAILVISAMPVYAQAQEPSPSVTAARIVADTISSDPDQIEDANEKKDSKTADELTQKMKELEERLGPEYGSFMNGLQNIDPESDDGVEIEATLRALNRSCAKK
jgi:hypothetical protein